MRLLFQIERRVGQHSEVVRSYRVPGYEAPIWLRDTFADHSFFWQCIVVRQYAVEAFPQARRLLAEYDRILRRGDVPVILDAGGNIGLAAIWFARAFPRSVVISVEPERRNFALLTRNVAPLGQRIMPVFGAVAERRKHLFIVNPDAGSGAFRVQESSSSTPTTFLDTPSMSSLRRCPRVSCSLQERHQRQPEASVLVQRRMGGTGTADHLGVGRLGRRRLKPFFAAVCRYLFDYLSENIFCFRHL